CATPPSSSPAGGRAPAGPGPKPRPLLPVRYSRNVGSSAAALLCLLDLLVDLLVDLTEAADEILHLPRLPLDDEVRERRQVVEADRGDRCRLRVLVDKDLDERLEVRVGDQLLRPGGADGRGHVPDPVRELRQRVVVRGQVLDERPGLVT